MNCKPHLLIIQRKYTVLTLVVVSIAGLLSKQNPITYFDWVNNHLAGLFYTIFWILIVFLFFKDKLNINHIPVIILCFTLAIEFLQLWHPAILTNLRGTSLGKIVLGTTFSWWDIPFYIVGCLLGWQLIVFLNKIER